MKKNLVYKSNDIIEASYALTINEQRLLLACISQIDSTKPLDLERGYTVTVEQAQDLFYNQSASQNAYRDLERASERLYRRELVLKSADERYKRITRWVSAIDFDNKTMSATLYFHAQIEPFISNLIDNFTRYRLEHISELTSIYAVRLYELLVSWYTKASRYKPDESHFRELEIVDFRNMLALENKYKQHTEFNRRVVEPAVSQINEFTDYNVEVSFKKRGRSFRWIQIKYNRKQQHKEADNAQRIINESRKIAYQKRLEEERENKIKNMRLPADGTILKSGDKIFQIEGDAVRMVGEYRAYIPPQALKKMLFNGEVTELAESDQLLDEYRDKDGYLDLFGEF